MTEQNQTPTEFAGEMQELIDDVQREAMAYGIDADGQEDMARYIREAALNAAREAAVRQGVSPTAIGMEEDPYGVMAQATDAYDDEPEHYTVDPREMTMQQRKAFLDAYHLSMGAADLGERMAEALGMSVAAGWEAIGGYASEE